MATVNVKVKLAFKDLINQMMDDATKQAIGQAVVDQSKELIAAGQSPVEGVGRFAGYKAQENANSERKKLSKDRKRLKQFSRGLTDVASSNTAKKGLAKTKNTHSFRAYKITKDEHKGYPHNVMKKYPDKKVRPVNLSLSGEMLDALTFRVGAGLSVLVGFMGAGAKINTIAQAHNDGPTNDAFERRQFLPEPGQNFTVSIMRAVKAIYSERIAAIIKQSNSK